MQPHRGQALHFVSLAIPIGVGIAVLVFLFVPGLRSSILGSFQKGHEAGQRMSGKKPGNDTK